MSDIKYQEDGANKIYNRLFEENNQKYLLADEVGLGKTVTAAKVIVRMAKSLKKDGRPIEIAYICGNLALASENVSKLIDKISEFSEGKEDKIEVTDKASERLSLAFFQLAQKDEILTSRINIYAISPMTTILARSTGTADEKAYAYMLTCDSEEDEWLRDFCERKSDGQGNVAFKKALRLIDNNIIINSKREEFKKIFEKEWKNILANDLINAFIECAISKLPEFETEESDIKAYNLLNLLEAEKENSRKIFERKIKELIKDNKIDICYSTSVEAEKEQARKSTEGINYIQTRKILNTVKLGMLENRQALVMNLKNIMKNMNEKCFTYMFLNNTRDLLERELGPYSENIYKVTDNEVENIEDSIKAALRETVYKEWFIAARRSMIELSLEDLKMDLFIADEIQNYSNIFRIQNKDSEYNCLIDRIIKDDNKVLMMSATPFRYHSIFNSLENAQKDSEADSETDLQESLDISDIYIKDETDIYDEFMMINKYLYSNNGIPCESFDDWKNNWDDFNKCKKKCIAENSIDDYLKTIEKQSNMMQKLNISRVERYVSGMVSDFKDKETEIPIDTVFKHELKRMIEAGKELTVCDTDVEELPDSFIMLREQNMYYIVTTTNNSNVFRYAQGWLADKLLYDTNYEDESEEAYDDDYNQIIEDTRAWRVLNYDLNYDFYELDHKETEKLHCELQSKLDNSKVRLDYYKSIPAVFSFAQNYVSLAGAKDSNISNKISYNRVKEYEVLFAYEKDGEIKGADTLICNARINRIFKKLFDEEEQHKLLFIPPSRIDVDLKGVYKDKRGVSKRLFFSDYNMIPRSLSALITYEAERRVVNDIKEKYPSYEIMNIKLYNGEEASIINVKELLSYGNNNKYVGELAEKLYMHDKATHKDGEKRKGSIYDYACDRFRTEAEKKNFCKAYYKYMTQKTSLRIVLAYTDDDSSEVNIFDKILVYGENGCIWDVLDEYSTYYKKKYKGEMFCDAFERILDIDFKQIRVIGNAGEATSFFNTHFASGHFAGDKLDSASPAKAFENKMARFNSPFWPFQFISTSIGQEGFDFHTYCRKVVHWSLEYNPVKFEQREGRVNRYQGYANRLKLAYFMKEHNILFDDCGDWKKAFEKVRMSKDGEIEKLVQNSKGLFPDFVVPTNQEEECGLEREFYYYPYSYESNTYKDVLKCVGYYRSLLGQSGNDIDKFEAAFRGFVEKNQISDFRKYFVDLYPF